MELDQWQHPIFRSLSCDIVVGLRTAIDGTDEGKIKDLWRKTKQDWFSLAKQMRLDLYPSVVSLNFLFRNFF